MTKRGHLELVRPSHGVDRESLTSMAASVDMFTRSLKETLWHLAEAGASARTIQLGNAAVADSRNFAEELREEAKRCR